MDLFELQLGSKGREHQLLDGEKNVAFSPIALIPSDIGANGTFPARSDSFASHASLSIACDPLRNLSEMESIDGIGYGQRKESRFFEERPKKEFPKM